MQSHLERQRLRPEIGQVALTDALPTREEVTSQRKETFANFGKVYPPQIGDILGPFHDIGEESSTASASGYNNTSLSFHSNASASSYHNSSTVNLVARREVEKPRNKRSLSQQDNDPAWRDYQPTSQRPAKVSAKSRDHSNNARHRQHSGDTGHRSTREDPWQQPYGGNREEYQFRAHRYSSSTSPRYAKWTSGCPDCTVNRYCDACWKRQRSK